MRKRWLLALAAAAGVLADWLEGAGRDVALDDVAHERREPLEQVVPAARLLGQQAECCIPETHPSIVELTCHYWNVDGRNRRAAAQYFTLDMSAMDCHSCGMTDVTTDSANLPSAGQFFEVGNYAPVPDEITEHNLPIEGAIPPEIDGWYLRNGPNPRFASSGLHHWFDGDGMVHALRVEEHHRRDREVRRGHRGRDVFLDLHRSPESALTGPVGPTAYLVAQSAQHRGQVGRYQ